MCIFTHIRFPSVLVDELTMTNNSPQALGYYKTQATLPQLVIQLCI